MRSAAKPQSASAQAIDPRLDSVAPNCRRPVHGVCEKSPEKLVESANNVKE
jgi:hypothetical protein